MTPMMKCHDIVAAFNTTTERKYWNATIAGSRQYPCVNFVSRASMIKITYWPSNNTYTVAFSKTACAFGDYVASIYRSMVQILTALKAAGEPVEVPLDAAGELRIKYHPVTKQMEISLANVNDDWTDAEPMPFKATDPLETNDSPLQLNPLTAF